MNHKIHINKQFAYLIITVLVITILYLIKLLLEYPFFQNIQSALFAIFFPFLISFTVVYIFHPVLYWFEKKLLIKTWVSTLIILLINVIILIVLIEILLPIVTVEFKNILVELPKNVDKLEIYVKRLQNRFDFLNNNQFYETFISIKDLITENIGNILINFAISSVLFSFKSIWIFIFIPILIFIMMKDYSLLYNKFSQMLMNHKRSEWIQLLKNIDNKLGVYLRGQLIKMGYMFIGTLLLFTVIGMPNAVIFSLIIALTSIIPYIGIIIGGLPLLIYTAFHSTYLLITSLLAVIIMLLIDRNICKPVIFGNWIKIHPLITLTVLLIGGAFGGIIGLYISIPIYIIVSEIFIFYKPKIKNKLKA